MASSTGWNIARWLTALAVAAVVGLALVVSVDMLVRFAAEGAEPGWSRLLPYLGWPEGLVGIPAALATLVILLRAKSGPSLFRRAGGILFTLGAVLVLTGLALFVLPQRPPVHPGREAAGDVAGGMVAEVVGLFGGASLVIASVLMMIGLTWAGIRARRSR